MTKVPEKKKKTVAEFVNLIDTYPVIGVVNMKNIPTKQLQIMRRKLREKDTVLKMTKKRLMKIAFSKAKKKKIAELEKYLDGIPALIFTNENPFQLYAELQKTKSKAPAKPGQEAPNNIKVSAGATNFSPGPIIGQLGKYGIKTGVEAGKLVIKEDAIVAKKGDTIDLELAGILTRLGIEPMEIGLNIKVVYEDESFFTSEVLHIDVDEYRNKIITSHMESVNLAVYTGYPTEDTITIMIRKAHGEARALSSSQMIFTDENAEEIVLRAHSQMLSLSNSLPKEALSVKEKESEEDNSKEETPEQNQEEPKEEKTEE